MIYQFFSPSLQCVTLFLPVGGRGGQLLHRAVSVQAALGLGLLLGQVALLIAGSESPETSVRSQSRIKTADPKIRKRKQRRETIYLMRSLSH